MPRRAEFYFDGNITTQRIKAPRRTLEGRRARRRGAPSSKAYEHGDGPAHGAVLDAETTVAEWRWSGIRTAARASRRPGRGLYASRINHHICRSSGHAGPGREARRVWPGAGAVQLRPQKNRQQDGLLLRCDERPDLPLACEKIKAKGKKAERSRRPVEGGGEGHAGVYFSSCWGSMPRCAGIAASVQEHDLQSTPPGAVNHAMRLTGSRAEFPAPRSRRRRTGHRLRGWPRCFGSRNQQRLCFCTLDGSPTYQKSTETL